MKLKSKEKTHRDFEVHITWGMNMQYNDILVMRSTSKSIPLMSVIKKLGQTYFRCVINKIYVIHSQSIKTHIKEFDGKSPVGYHGTHYEALNRLIKDIKPKYKNVL